MKILKKINRDKTIFQARKAFLVIILFFCIILFLISCTNSYNKIPKCKNGILDLRGWDLARDEVIRLDGEWEFYWKQLLEPKDFLSKDKPQKSGLIKVPGDWLNLQKKIKKVPRFGYASYRLIILLDRDINNLALRVNNINIACVIYVNGVKIGSIGKIGKNIKEEIPKFSPQVFYFTSNKNEIEILIQVSNFHHYAGGIVNSISFGTEKKLQIQREHDIVIQLFFTGINFVMFLYHLLFFIIRRKDKSILYFSLICLGVAIYTLVTGEIYLASFIPSISWELILRLWPTGSIAAVICLILLIHYLFPQEFKKIIMRIFILFYVLSWLFFIILSPAQSNYIMGNIANITLIFLIIYIIFVLVLAVIRKRDVALIFLIGFIFFGITAINDVLYTIGIIQIGGHFAYIGLFVFIFSQASTISLRTLNAFLQTEKLSIELTDLNKNLETKVEERTYELTIANKQLKLANEQKTQLFVNIAHETKTPLTLIKNYLDKYIKTTSLTKELSIVKHNIDKLLRDMVNFLQAERLKDNQVYYNHIQIVDFTDILEKRITLFKEVAKQKKIDILVNIASIPIFLKGDPHAVDSIINNLIDNAIKYTEEHGEVTVTLKQRGDDLIFSVQDTGIGIPEEHLKNIFKPFHQLSYKKKNIQGIGMGLFIVYKIIESLNGSIDVESKENEGSNFIVTLKSCIPEEIDNIQKDIYLSPPPDIYPDKIKLVEKKIDPQKYTLFIVEDNLEMLNFLVSELQKYYNVFFARNGKLALERLEEISKPSIIISDIMMDEMDGIEFFKKINVMEKYQNTPLIFLTAKTGIEDKLAGLKVGAIDYIQKPFLMEELLLRIKSILDNLEKQKREDIKKIEKEISETISVLKMKSGGTDIPKMNNLDEIYKKYNISGKEEKILDLLLQGYQNKEICSILNISLKTVENHLHNIYKKFGIKNRIELFKFLK